MSDHNQEQPRLPLFAEQGQVDGRGDELADHREEEGRHRTRVLRSIQDFLGKRKRK